MFTTSKLAKMICDAPGFPMDQKPSLTTQDVDAWQHIILSPLHHEAPLSWAQLIPAEDADEGVPDPQFLNLTFHFKRRQDEADLKQLADHLKKFMKVSSTDLHKVYWGAIWGERNPSADRFREAVQRAMAHTQPTDSRSNNPNWPSISVRVDRLSPHQGHYPSDSSPERTPLHFDTSSATLEEEASTWGFWNRTFS
jgi:hypothetical protein